jgi:hypothetical protein
MFFIPYAEWMEKTRSRLSARSTTLKALDKAIMEAEDASEDDETVMRWFADGAEALSPGAKSALEIEKAARGLAIAEVRAAFGAWAADQTRKGQDWRASVRNESGAVTTLAGQITFWTRTYPDAGERAALEEVATQRNKSIPLLFENTEVVVYDDRFTRMDDRMAKANAAKIAVNSYKLSRPPAPLHHAPGGGGSGFLHSISAEIDRMVTDAFGSNFLALAWDSAENAVKSAVEYAITEIKDEIAALAPGVGLGVASATLVWNTTKLIMQSIAADEMVDLSQRLEDGGDSRLALERVRDWQLRAIAARTSKVARAGVNVGLHSAAIASCGVGIPVQLAVSLANAILGLASVIGELGMQYKESRALAAYLKRPDLGRNIFGQAPLAAAYYLLNTPDSHIALQLVQIGAAGWQEDVERLKRDGVLKTTLGEAQNLIAGARYRLRKKDGTHFRERRAISLTTRIKDRIK